MSTYASKSAAERLARPDYSAHTGLRTWPGPVESAALWVAHLHGQIVWLVLIAGFSGFRNEAVLSTAAFLCFSAPQLLGSALLASVY